MKDYQGLWLVSIVAIVGIVALVVLIQGSTPQYIPTQPAPTYTDAPQITEAGNIAGQAFDEGDIVYRCTRGLGDWYTLEFLQDGETVAVMEDFVDANSCENAGRRLVPAR